MNDELGAPSVLLVDDRPENLIALEATLKPLKARLVKARSGEEALVHLLRETFAVILLDVQMPKLDGADGGADQAARADEARAHHLHHRAEPRGGLRLQGLCAGRGGLPAQAHRPGDPPRQGAGLLRFWVRGERLHKQAAQSEMKDVFLASVAHEMRTPLAAAKAQAQLALHQLSESGCDAPSAGALQLISRQIDKVARLVSDLLDMNRLDAGVLQLTRGEVDLGVLAREVVARLHVLTPSSNISVSAPEHLPIVGDRDRLEQVLTNLVTNAIRYSPANATIEVRAEMNGDSAKLAVRDHGMAVPLDSAAAHLRPLCPRPPRRRGTRARTCHRQGHRRTARRQHLGGVERRSRRRQRVLRAPAGGWKR